MAFDIAGVWGLVTSGLWPTIELIGYTYISPGLLRTFYVWIVSLATASLLLLNWPWIKRRCTAKRRAQEAVRLKAAREFHEYAKELHNLRETIRTHKRTYRKGNYRIEPELNSELTSVFVKLKSVGLMSPPLSVKANEQGWQCLDAWEAYLDFIVPLAELGDRDEARRIGLHERVRPLMAPAKPGGGEYQGGGGVVC